MNPFDVLFAPATPRITARVKTVKRPGGQLGNNPQPLRKRPDVREAALLREKQRRG